MFKPKYNPDAFYHWSKIEVRFSDLDALNHVNNAVFNTYYEEARLQFLGEATSLANEFKNGKSFVLVRAEVDYLGQIKYPDTLLIGTGVEKLGNTSVVAAQAIYSAKTKQILSVARTTGVWFDIKKQKPTKLPTLANMDEMLINPDLYG